MHSCAQALSDHGAKSMMRSKRSPCLHEKPYGPRCMLKTGNKRLLVSEAKLPQRALKYCTARSCVSAAFLVLKVPRFRRLPVLGSFLREYKRYWPDGSFRIILISLCNGRNSSDS